MTSRSHPNDALYVPRTRTRDHRPRRGRLRPARENLRDPVAKRYPLQFVAWKDVQKDPAPALKAGGATERSSTS